MASQLKSAGLGQSIVWAYGSKHWSTPTNIYTSNNAYAYISLSIEQRSHWLRATNFGFTIPAGATINGIKVEIEKKSNSTGIEDGSVKIVKGGAESGTEHASGAFWPTTDTRITYGGSTDKWGLTWTVANINASNFGISIAASNAWTSGRVAYVDHIRITVYYTAPPPLPDMKVNISDTFRQVSEIKINVGGSWRTVVKVQINIGDTWRTVFG